MWHFVIACSYFGAVHALKLGSAVRDRGFDCSDGTTLMMLETRGLEHEMDGALNSSTSYWKKTAVINWLYSKKYAYDFTYIHVISMPEACQGWAIQACKPWILNDAFFPQDASASKTCGLYLDSDAVIADSGGSLNRLYDNITQQICHGAATCDDRVGLVLEMEEGASWACVNTGVFLIANNDVGRNIFKSWIDAQHLPENEYFKRNWPYEQAVFENLVGVHNVDPSNVGLWSVPEHPGKVGITRARTMNTPWGAFIRHIWSGPGNRLRLTVYDEMLQDLGIDSISKLNDALDEITGSHGYRRME